MDQRKGKRAIYVVFMGFAGLVVIYVVASNPGFDQVRSIHAENMPLIANHNLFNLNSADWMKLEQRRRVQRIRDACANTSLFAGQIYNEQNLLKYMYFYAKEYNFNYCKVPKVGSSFWTQAFTVLNKGSGVADYVFGLPRKSVHIKFTSKNRVKFDSNERRMSRSVLVSRNPYSRLYSAFVDKILLKRTDLRKTKKDYQYFTDNLICGSEMTFQEFLQWVLKAAFEGKPLNRHWRPIMSLCNPCNVVPLTLVKQESFAADVEFTLKEIGVAADKLKVILDALHDKRIEDTVPGIIYTVLKSKSMRIPCKPTQSNAAARLWLSFQIQGYIRDDTPLSDDFIDSDEIVVPEFLSDLILKTIRESPLTAEESEEQRHRYLANAYNKIDKETIEGIQKVYKQDFIIFGYSFEPPSVKNSDKELV